MGARLACCGGHVTHGCCRDQTSRSSRQMSQGAVTSVKMVEIGVGFRVAIGQAARGGSLPGSASSRGGVSSEVDPDRETAGAAFKV